MWLATVYGFYSVVCARQNGGKSSKPDTENLMIRARRKEHLEALKTRFPDALGSIAIIESPRNDYHWRIVTPKAIWADCARELVMELTCTNFKNECGKRLHHSDPYLLALHETWGVMKGMQEMETRWVK